MKSFAAGALGALLLLAGDVVAQMSVSLDLDQGTYVQGEAIRANVLIVNHATTPFIVGPGAYRQNGLYFQITDNRRDLLEPSQTSAPMIAELRLSGGETYRGAFEIDEWYPMGKTGNYLVTAMVRRDDRRYESKTKAIGIVPGLELRCSIQQFADRPDFQRKLSLVYYMRRQLEFLFLKVTDTPGDRTWTTLELGQLLRTTPPTIEIAADGMVTILHRASQDVFLRTRVKSTAAGVELIRQEQIVETHDTESQQEQQIQQLLDANKKKVATHWWWPFGGSGEKK